jgi:hypothetical protein
MPVEGVCEMMMRWWGPSSNFSGLANGGRSSSAGTAEPDCKEALNPRHLISLAFGMALTVVQQENEMQS